MTWGPSDPLGILVAQSSCWVLLPKLCNVEYSTSRWPKEEVKRTDWQLDGWSASGKHRVCSTCYMPLLLFGKEGNECGNAQSHDKPQSGRIIEKRIGSTTSKRDSHA